MVVVGLAANEAGKGGGADGAALGGGALSVEEGAETGPGGKHGVDEFEGGGVEAEPGVGADPGAEAIAEVGVELVADLTWPEITRDNKPWTRWWWPGSGVDKASLTRQLEQ